MNKIFIVIPAYNEESVIQEVIAGIKNEGYDNIIIVDDGSKDNTFQKIKEIQKKIQGVVTLRHKINRGKGAATKTGIEAAKLMGADIIATMDGDDQHDPRDISKLIEPIIAKTSDVVLGNRLKNPQGMPYRRRFQNSIANLMTWYIFGLWVSDSQSGFRAYSRKAAEAIKTRYDKYEYESEVIREIHLKRLKYSEVPIAVRYTKYSINKSHGQNLWNGIKTLQKMLWRLLIS
jgi:UDP-N-acetylglucosamine---dolichyl-phosphate N-acetylglucosaminyltransferase